MKVIKTITIGILIIATLAVVYRYIVLPSQNASYRKFTQVSGPKVVIGAS